MSPIFAATRQALLLLVSPIWLRSSEALAQLVLSGQMSVQKLWLAGDVKDAPEYFAELNPDALEPKGNVIKESDGTTLEPGALPPAVHRAVLVASLCNVATYVPFRSPIHQLLNAFTVFEGT